MNAFDVRTIAPPQDFPRHQPNNHDVVTLGAKQELLPNTGNGVRSKNVPHEPSGRPPQWPRYSLDFDVCAIIQGRTTHGEGYCSQIDVRGKVSLSGQVRESGLT